MHRPPEDTCGSPTTKPNLDKQPAAHDRPNPELTSPRQDKRQQKRASHTGRTGRGAPTGAGVVRFVGASAMRHVSWCSAVVRSVLEVTLAVTVAVTVAVTGGDAPPPGSFASWLWGPWLARSRCSPQIPWKQASCPDRRHPSALAVADVRPALEAVLRTASEGTNFSWCEGHLRLNASLAADVAP